MADSSSDDVLDLTQEDDCGGGRPSTTITASSGAGKRYDSPSEEDDDDDGLLDMSPVFSRKRGGVSKKSTNFSKAAAPAADVGRAKRPRPAATTSMAAAASSSSSAAAAADEAEELGAASTKEGRAALRALERKRAAESKRLEKERKASEREAARRTKARKAEEAKRERAIRVMQEKQSTGKFATEEICAIVDRDTIGNDDERSGGLGGEVVGALLEKGYKVAAVNPPREEFGVAPAAAGRRRSRGYGCVRWVRRDKLRGGASAALRSIPGAVEIPAASSDGEGRSEDAANAQSKSVDAIILDGDDDNSDEGAQRMGIVAVLFSVPGTFLDLLARDADAEARDDYPLLRSWLAGARSYLQTWEQSDSDNGSKGNDGGNGGKGSRVILVLHEVQKELSRRWNRSGTTASSSLSSPGPATEEELQDAIAWLLLEERVECALTSSSGETAEYVANMTRALSELPYQEETTELHCVKKLKADPAVAMSGSDLAKAGDTWMRMLRQIPGMSEPRARRLVATFPTARSLQDAYDDPELTVEQKRTLVAQLLVEGRNNVKLSDCLHRLMTSSDPDELL